MTISTADGVSLTDDISEASVKAALNATGAAPVYAARAFVNFNGTSFVVQGATYSRTGTTVTVNFSTVNPEIAVGDVIYVDFTTGTAADGAFTVLTSELSGSDYIVTFTHGTSGSTSGSCQTQKNPIRIAKNVSGIAYQSAGVYYISPESKPGSVNFAWTLDHIKTTDANWLQTLKVDAVSTSGVRTASDATDYIASGAQHYNHSYVNAIFYW